MVCLSVYLSLGLSVYRTLYQFTDVNRVRSAKARHMLGHRNKAKAENAKVNFWVNATVNPVFQFRIIIDIVYKTAVTL